MIQPHFLKAVKDNSIKWDKSIIIDSQPISFTKIRFSSRNKVKTDARNRWKLFNFVDNPNNLFDERNAFQERKLLLINRMKYEFDDFIEREREQGGKKGKYKRILQQPEEWNYRNPPHDVESCQQITLNKKSNGLCEFYFFFLNIQYDESCP